ncbi:MAG TPA: hypothetical protein VL283_02445 [Candidatus Baltobacteraceae bacterium]|nr:hypothetical protein [Candidatus Baltobacteraceae bacterium]
MKRLLSACALLLLLGAGCPLLPEKAAKPAPSAPPTEEPAPAPKPEGATADGCRRTGCSGQLCADQDMVSTCEYRPEYACYKDAACERQADGKCGWTPSAALTACLGAAAGTN